ncbi:MAG: cytochrome c biogenesis protein CcsA [Flavobacteriaceae bacterium]|nr:cytochrome c biogenesis protein CcsA [Flavobacteriaceae bacterium]
MGKKIISFLISTRFTAILFILFPLSMGIGTFIESYYNTTTAKILIYNAKWFEIMMVFFVINFSYNIKRYNLLNFNKWPVLLLHISWILIILGAGITRYIGFEGVMPIRENESSNTFLSEKTYLTVFVDGEKDGQTIRKVLEGDLLFSENTNNFFKWNYKFDNQDFSVEYVNFIENAKEDLIASENGEMYLKIVEASNGGRHDHFLKSGQVTNVHNILFALNNDTKGAINITTLENGSLSINSPFEGDYLRMADQFAGSLKENIDQPLMLRSLYNAAGLQFVFPENIIKGDFQIVKSDDLESQQDGLFVKVSSNGESKILGLMGGKGIVNTPKQIKLGNLDFSLKFGSLERILPFEIKLNDFIAEKYPGTEKSYSSFESKVTVIDDANFDYDIYMNHILNHKGYRFFQASFDPDEKGTVLSVNHDFYGTLITYIGYFLLYIGLLGIMFFGKTRFKDLANKLEKLKIKKQSLIIFMFFFSSFSYAQDEHKHDQTNLNQTDSSIVDSQVSLEHAEEFGSLVIQDSGGRMKPLNTFASELLRKVSKSDTFNGLNADQVLISIIKNPISWYNVPFIYLKKGNDSIRKIAGRNEKEKYASFVDFFDDRGSYKISSQLEDAYKASLPNQFQKDFIELDRRVNLLFSAFEGKILRIFPIPNDINNKWVAFPDVQPKDFNGIDSLYVKNVLPLYLGALENDIKTGDYDNSKKLLESIRGFQTKYGSEILPSEDKLKAEILYNKYDIFKNLFSWYMYVGTLMFAFLIFQIFYENKFMKILVLLSKYAIVGLFILHTLGLIARSYVSGHAPWSDAYESMIYVAWATVAMGLAFGRKSNLTIASTSFVSAMILMIAHWNWMDPQIANLVPVLDSYWLMIHVSVIVGSYGPFALSMILGIVSLFLILITNKKNKKRVNLNLQELTIINELSVTVGLIMLTIGNFLGGQWANESWGRYWGWDPKETWALISIMVYAFVLHMRLIPGLKGKWIFNLMSILAFASIMMTYFGVNFYLTGLHSYASGDKVITPDFVYYSLFFVLLLGFLSYFKHKKYY